MQAIQLEAVVLITNAELMGRALFGSYMSRQPDDGAATQAAKDTALAAATDRCKTPYRAIRVRGYVPNVTQVDSIVIYLIGDASKQSVMLGRHYRVELSPDGKTVRSVVVSAKDCSELNLAALTGAQYIVNPLSSAPTEFHVFLNLLYKAKFRVRSAMGVWEIDNGEVKPLAFDPNYQPEKITVKDCVLPDGSRFATTETACRKTGGIVQ